MNFQGQGLTTVDKPFTFLCTSCIIDTYNIFCYDPNKKVTEICISILFPHILEMLKRTRLVSYIAILSEKKNEKNLKCLKHLNLKKIGYD